MQLTLVLLERTVLAFLEAGVPVHAFGTVAANRPSVLGIITIAGFNKKGIIPSRVVPGVHFLSHNDVAALCTGPVATRGNCTPRYQHRPLRR